MELKILKRLVPQKLTLKKRLENRLLVLQMYTAMLPGFLPLLLQVMDRKGEPLMANP
jgi:hypothetical protein